MPGLRSAGLAVGREDRLEVGEKKVKLKPVKIWNLRKWAGTYEPKLETILLSLLPNLQLWCRYFAVGEAHLTTELHRNLPQYYLEKQRRRSDRSWRNCEPSCMSHANEGEPRDPWYCVRTAVASGLTLTFWIWLLLQFCLLSLMGLSF